MGMQVKRTPLSRLFNFHLQQSLAIPQKPTKSDMANEVEDSGTIVGYILDKQHELNTHASCALVDNYLIHVADMGYGESLTISQAFAHKPTAITV